MTLEKSMHVRFEIGSPTLGSVNSMNFSLIRDKIEIEKVKSLIQASGLDISSKLQELCPVKDDDSAAYQLKIHLKDAYCDFKHVFKDAGYLKLKVMLMTEFPELSDEFPIVEKHTHDSQQLNLILEELEDYQRYGFFGSVDYIRELQNRVKELQQELHSSNILKKMV